MLAEEQKALIYRAFHVTSAMRRKRGRGLLRLQRLTRGAHGAGFCALVHSTGAQGADFEGRGGT